MRPEPVDVEQQIETIATPRLELVAMSVPFMQALQRRDLVAASDELGADVPLWMADELENFLRYRLGQLERDSTIREWLGRAIVLTDAAGVRHAIGSIGFHGPPDAEGRLEVGYSVDPPYRRRGFRSRVGSRDVRLGALEARNLALHRLGLADQRRVAQPDRRSSASRRSASRWTRSTASSSSSKRPGRPARRARSGG